MTTNQSWYKREYKSLIKLLQEYRRVNKEFEKRNKGFKIAILVEIVVFVLYLLIFVGFGMRNFSRDTRTLALILCLATIMIFLLLDVFIWFMTIYKPKKEFLKRAKAHFPGIDLSSENSIKKYLWTFKDRELLQNLAPLIVWEGASRKKGEAEESETYTEVEQVVLDVWQTNSIDQELYEFYFLDENEPTYLEDVIASFNTIGANEEAKIWLEAKELFRRIKKLEYDEDVPESNDENHFIYSIKGLDGEARFTCDEEERIWLSDLKERQHNLRENTERMLYQYVMEHKDEFNFGNNTD